LVWCGEVWGVAYDRTITVVGLAIKPGKVERVIAVKAIIGDVLARPSIVSIIVFPSDTFHRATSPITWLLPRIKIIDQGVGMARRPHIIFYSIVIVTVIPSTEKRECH